MQLKFKQFDDAHRHVNSSIIFQSLCLYVEWVHIALITSTHHLFLSLSPPAEVAHQFQYAVRVIGSNYAPTIERDEFLVSEKIKKEREYDDTVMYELIPLWRCQVEPLHERVKSLYCAINNKKSQRKF